MLRIATASPAAPLAPPPDWASAPRALMLPVRPTCRPYRLQDMLRLSPSPQPSATGTANEAHIPLQLDLTLHDAAGQTIPGAAVYLWHHDPQGWTVDFAGNDLQTISCMSALQISDAQGCVRFQLNHPSNPQEGAPAILLRIYFMQRRRFTLRTQVVLLLPAQDRQDPSLSAYPTLHRRLPGDGMDATVISLNQLTRNLVSGRLEGLVQLGVAI